MQEPLDQADQAIERLPHVDRAAVRENLAWLPRQEHAQPRTRAVVPSANSNSTTQRLAGCDAAATSTNAADRSRRRSLRSQSWNVLAETPVLRQNAARVWPLRSYSAKIDFQSASLRCTRSFVTRPFVSTCRPPEKRKTDSRRLSSTGIRKLELRSVY